MCEKHTEVMKEQHASVHAFPCSELEPHTSLCEMRPPPLLESILQRQTVIVLVKRVSFSSPCESWK